MARRLAIVPVVALLLGCGREPTSPGPILLGVWGAGQVEVEAKPSQVNIRSGCIDAHFPGSIELGPDGDFHGQVTARGPELVPIEVRFEGRLAENDDLTLTLTINGFRLPTFTLLNGWRADLADLFCPL